MYQPTITDDDMRRLRAEREAADRAYNDALTAVDHALPPVPEPPSAIPSPDLGAARPLHERWAIVPEAPPMAGRGLRARLAGFIWRVVGPMLQRQQEFNAAVVAHAEQAAAAERVAREAIEASLRATHHHLGAIVSFQSTLIQYLQQITLYVDTKDRQLSGEIRQTTDMLDHRTAGLSAALSGLGDEVLKRWEASRAREDRLDARIEGLRRAHEQDVSEVRIALAALERSAGALRRQIERVATGVGGAQSVSEAAAPTAASTDGGQPPATVAAAAVASLQLAASPRDASTYVGFEDAFRGAADEIRERQADYVSLFAGATDVVDIGCGRGEFLEALRAAGITARGVDLNSEMVAACRARNLDVVEGDALAFLAALPDQSIGGLFAAQVVEHLLPDQLLRLLDVAFRTLRPGARIVLETVNPACWYAFFESYIRDITHVRPIHPDTLRYLLQATGFQKVEIRFRAPYPERGKLQAVAIPPPVDEAGALSPLADLAETFNANVDKINQLLFTFLDYAAIATRP